MSELVRYEAARRALAQACRVDEAKSIRDKAKAMQVYAQQANDPTLIDHATDIRMRAEIRAGELLAEMKRNGARQTDGKPKRSQAATVTLPKLSDLGVSKTQSSRWQRLAKLPPDEQEKRIAAAKQKAQAAVSPTRSARGSTPRRRFIRSKARELSESCAARVRNLVVEAMRLAKDAEELSAIFAALRDELNDLEADAARITNGHLS